MSKPISEWTDAEIFEYTRESSAIRGRAFAAEVLALRAELAAARAEIERLSDARVDEIKMTRLYKGSAEQLEAQVLWMRGAEEESLRTIENLNARAENAEAELAAAREQILQHDIHVGMLRDSANEQHDLAVHHGQRADAAEVELAAARARLDDFEHMPCEECLTYAPGPEFAHLKAEKDHYMDRTFKAEADLGKSRAEAWDEGYSEAEHRALDQHGVLFQEDQPYERNPYRGAEAEVNDRRIICQGMHQRSARDGQVGFDPDANTVLKFCLRCGEGGPFNGQGWCQGCASPGYT